MGESQLGAGDRDELALSCPQGIELFVQNSVDAIHCAVGSQQPDKSDLVAVTVAASGQQYVRGRWVGVQVSVVGDVVLTT